MKQNKINYLLKIDLNTYLFFSNLTMSGILKEVNIIIELALKDIKLRYHNSNFGYVWMFINPFLLLATLYIVFSNIMNLKIENYQIFLLLGILVWNFFSEATSKSISQLSESINTIKKIKISVSSIILGANLSSFITFCVNLLILLLMMLFFKIKIFTAIRLFSILYFFLLFLLAISVSFFVSTMYIHFKDITHVWDFFLLVGFWIAPIVYPVSFVPQQYLKYYMINPITRIVSHLRNSVIYNYTDSSYQIMITVIIVVSIFLISIWFYKKFSNKIYDII